MSSFRSTINLWGQGGRRRLSQVVSLPVAEGTLAQVQSSRDPLDILRDRKELPLGWQRGAVPVGRELQDPSQRPANPLSQLAKRVKLTGGGETGTASLTSADLYLDRC